MLVSNNYKLRLLKAHVMIFVVVPVYMIVNLYK